MYRKVALVSLVVAFALCGVMLTRRFHPVSVVFFAPAFLLPVLSAIFACSPKRTKRAAAGAMVGTVTASAALMIGAIALSTNERLAHGMYGFFDFLAIAVVASLAAVVAITVGFGVGAMLGRRVPS